MKKFSIIAYFDEETTKEIRDIQIELSRLSGSVGSISAWLPHITIGSGLEVEDSELGIFINKIQKFLDVIPVTEIKTKEFSYMDNWSGKKLGYSPYVTYIKPYDCGTLGSVAVFFEEVLKKQYKSWYDQPWPYNPHITVAYKDLSEEGYGLIQSHLAGKLFERNIKIDNVCLATEGEGGFWNEFKRFQLRS
jgi:2'-5' RNA ligase